jgi:hypothetical protein
LVNLGNASYFYGNFGAGDTIDVTVGPVSAGLVIASFNVAGSTLTLNLENGTPNGPFDLEESVDAEFTSPTVNQSGFFDGNGSASVNVSIGGGNRFFRARE